MRRFSLTLTAAAAVLTAAAFVPSTASATPLGAPTGLGLDDMNPIQNVAICFYVDGWNGPGMYECGFRHRRGHGWHGRRDGDRDEGRGHDRGRRGDGRGPNERRDR
jgi:hypothetical protein